MKVRVLGSAAGGGFPQWNCGCQNCQAARRGAPGLVARTQESVAISADGVAWFLVNASPEIRTQIEAFEGLWPRDLRHSPIAGILLTNGDLDHCLGLLSLRESHPLAVYATEPVRAGFTEGNTIYRTLQRFPGQIAWRTLSSGQEQRLGEGDSDLLVTPISAPGKLPLHLEALRAPSPEDNIGLLFRDARTGGRLAYFSGVAGPSLETPPIPPAPFPPKSGERGSGTVLPGKPPLSPEIGGKGPGDRGQTDPSLAIERAAADADALFFDGTFWSSDELIAAGLGTRRAEDMAHWPLGGASGSLGFLQRQKARRRILIHVNNTNPILREDSEERRALERAGVEVAADGMELVL